MDNRTGQEPDNRTGTKDRKVVLAACGLCLLAYALVFLWFLQAPSAVQGAAVEGFPQDDAWIHMVYGRSVARTGLPLYNDTIEPGFTSPVWVAVAALAHIVGEPIAPVFPPLLLKLFGGLFLIGCGYLSARILRRLLPALSGISPFLAALASVWPLMDPHFVFGALSGMEVTGFAFFLLLSGMMVLEGRFFGAGLAFAGAVLTRPEGLVLAPLLAFAFLANPGDTRVRRAVGLCLPSVLGIGAWSLLCWFSSGLLLPNTAYNKLSDPVAAWAVLPDVFFHIVAPWSVIGGGVGLLFVLWGSGLLFVRFREGGAWGGGSLFFALSPWLLFFSTAFSRVALDTESFYWSRYFLPVLPLTVPAFLVGLKGAWDLLNDRFPTGISLAVLLVLVSGFALHGLYRYPDLRVKFGENCSDIQKLNVGMGKLIHARTPRSAVVGTNDAGAIRYFGKRRTIDLVGLNDHRYLFSSSAAAAFRKTRFTYFALSRGVFKSLKGRNTRRTARIEIPRNSLFAMHPYWIDLYEVIDPDIWEKAGKGGKKPTHGNSGAVP